MKLAEIVRSNSEAIHEEWEQFARSIQPKSRKLDKKTLRDHTEHLLKEIADDLETPRSEHEQSKKSQEQNLKSAMTSAAGKHWLERFQSGFGIPDIIAEYRFMRTIVIHLWSEQKLSEIINCYDLIIFNEVLEQKIFEAAGTFQIMREKAATDSMFASSLKTGV